MISKNAIWIALSFVSSVALAAPHGMYRTLRYERADAAKVIPQALTDSGQLQYYGGPVIEHAKIVSVFWGNSVNSETTAGIGGFFSAIVNSTYMDWLSEYNTNISSVSGQLGTKQTIGRGSYVNSVTITPSNTTMSLQDSDIQTELDAQITKGVLPKPDADTLYMVFFPPGVSITIDGQASCSAFCAYHEGFTSKTNGNVFYGVMPDLGGSCTFGCGLGGTPFDNLTTVTSHEMTEAITDPFPTPGSTPAFPQAWNTTGGQEIGDLCAQTSTTIAAGSTTYAAQQEFDNASNACAPGPYQAK